MKLTPIYKFQNECSMIQAFRRFQERMTMMSSWSNFPKNRHPLLFSQVLINQYSKEQKMIWLITLLIKTLSSHRLLFEIYQIVTLKSKRKSLCLNNLFEFRILGLMLHWTQNHNPHPDRQMILLFQSQDLMKSWWLKLNLTKCSTTDNKETFKIKQIHPKHLWESYSYAQDLMG